MNTSVFPSYYHCHYIATFEKYFLTTSDSTTQKQVRRSAFYRLAPRDAERANSSPKHHTAVTLLGSINPRGVKGLLQWSVWKWWEPGTRRLLWGWFEQVCAGSHRAVLYSRERGSFPRQMQPCAGARDLDSRDGLDFSLTCPLIWALLFRSMFLLWVRGDEYDRWCGNIIFET